MHVFQGCELYLIGHPPFYYVNITSCHVLFSPGLDSMFVLVHLLFIDQLIWMGKSPAEHYFLPKYPVSFGSVRLHMSYDLP